MFREEAAQESKVGIARRKMSKGQIRYYSKFDGRQYEAFNGQLTPVDVRKSPISYDDWEPADNDLKFLENQESRVGLAELVTQAILKRDRIWELAERLHEYGDWTEKQIVKDLDDLIQAATDLRNLL